MTPDSHRGNADIDPTVLIDDDGTPWMAWGNGDCYMVRLKRNMIELDGEIKKVPLRNYSEGPWLFKRGNLYYNVYASDAPGVQTEQMAYSYATSIEGPWTYGGFVSTSANYGFTIHPSVIQFKSIMTVHTCRMGNLVDNVVEVFVRNIFISIRMERLSSFLLPKRV